ncbi:amidase [Jeotgalibaca ciconiae]|uniref:Amidase n=1 Tax=Jeotgalibaca ciconiae TaxID=2496265 RepID=A0A3S9H834_9LACT|nr:amidase [Jeotgalibaca ciconiae]AZP03510.1 amidase [Jeotgalibaca ciconiae]HJB24020.1 amidase [Candidatus Jeotgalibaca pullicola]
MKLNRQEDGLYFADLIHSKQASAEEVVTESIRQIEEKNPSINAVIHNRFEKALKEARTKDFSNKPFAGVPILIKDLGQSLAGEPNTSGAKLFKNVISSQTSHYTQKLLDAGFIILGQTNTPEFGFKNITEPELYGPTRNPWDESYSPGGSSGGSSAAVASGMVPLAGASDGGGSIRIPASFTGLVGLKPTRGRTPIGPGSGRAWQGASIDFALTKSVRDTAAMLDVLQVIQASAAFQVPLFASGYQKELANHPTKKFRIAYSTQSPIRSSVSDEAKRAVLKTVKWLEEQGHIVEEKEPDIDGIDLMESYYLMNCGETTAVLEGIERSLGRDFTVEDMELVTWVMYHSGKKISAASYSNTIKSWDVAAEIMARFRESYDLYLTPATADSAPKVGTKWQSDSLMEKMAHIYEFNTEEQQKIVWDMFGDSLPVTPFGMQANLSGEPAISLPVHLTKEGLPLGVQFIAPKGKEHWLLHIGKDMEDAGLFI